MLLFVSTFWGIAISWIRLEKQSPRRVSVIPLSPQPTPLVTDYVWKDWCSIFRVSVRKDFFMCIIQTEKEISYILSHCSFSALLCDICNTCIMLLTSTAGGISGKIIPLSYAFNGGSLRHTVPSEWIQTPWLFQNKITFSLILKLIK